MTTPQPPQHQRAQHQPFLDGSITDGLSATVADEQGTILVTRHVERAPREPAPDDAVTVLAVDGEIDADTAPLLRAALRQALNGRNPVCCDLSRVTFFGATAANTLFAAQRYAVERRRGFLVRGVHGLAELVLTVVDPDRVIPRRE